MTTLGQRIREHRRRAGLSQEALARRMDVSRQAVTKWESGQSAPSTENLFRLAELFGTTVDLLLPSEGADAPAAEAPPPLWSRIRWRPRVLAALAVTAGYLVFYLLAHLWCPLEDSSLLGWLLWERPSRRGELSLRLAPQQRSLLVGHGPLRPDGAAGGGTGSPAPPAPIFSSDF